MACCIIYSGKPLSYKSSLNIIALSAMLGGGLSAAEVAAGLTIDGYVDTVLTIADGDEGATSSDDSTIDFSALAELEFRYQIGDDVMGRMDLAFSDDNPNTVTLKDAHILWDLSDDATLKVGKFGNWIGWEGGEAPELYRVNKAYVTDGGTLSGNGAPIGILGVDTTGVGLIYELNEEIEAGFFVVDEVYVDSTSRPTDSMSFGGYVDYTVDHLGKFQLNLSFGPDEFNGTDDISSVVAWTQIDAFQEDAGLLLACDVNYTDYNVDALLSVLLMANYQLSTDMPMSVTAMIDWIDPYLDDEGPLGSDDEGLEFALALLTNPTNNSDFACNVEARYISRSADDSNEYGLFVELLAIIP